MENVRNHREINLQQPKPERIFSIRAKLITKVFPENL